MRGFLAAAMALSFFATAPAAHAQIVRHIIGHAVAGKAVKSILGKDKEAPAKDAGANTSEPSSSEGIGSAEGPGSPDKALAQPVPDR